MEIADDIRKRIRENKISPGSRVGTFASLRRDYSAAKGTVDKALDVLRQEGTVVSMSGKGIFVADTAIEIEGTASRSPGDRLFTAQLKALSEEVRQLAARIDAVETSLASELGEAIAEVRAQVMNLYHSVGQAYPYEGDTASPAEKWAR
jgi:DNA-binding GntR family transcriptional regulator